MPADKQYRPPIPIFIPTLSVALVLGVLFSFGLKEQNRLANERIEQVINQRQTIAGIVADTIENGLRQTQQSVQRYASELGRQLDQGAPPAVVNAKFDQWFQPFPDDTYRSRRDRFNPQTQAGVWIPNYVTLNPEVKQFFVTSKEITELYGLGAQSRPFVDTWVLAAAGGVAIFWPDQPNFVYDAGADFDYRNTPWVNLTRPENNKDHGARWTKLIFDPISKVWMLSAVAPVYSQGKWVGAAGHDLPLDNLLHNTELLRQEQGSYFLLVTEDNRIVASARFADRIKQSNGALSLTDLNDPELARALDDVRHNPHAETQRIALPGRVLFVSHVGPGNWLLASIVPLTPISSGIENSFAKLRNIAILALIAELVIATMILAWSHSRSRRQFNNILKIQQQLAASESHYRALVDNIPGIVYRCRNDIHWTMIFLSPATAEFTGYPAEDFIDNKVRSFASIIHPDDREIVSNLVNNAYSHQKSYKLEYRIMCADGSMRWVLDHGRFVVEADTTPELEGVIVDVTAQKRAKEQLRELNNTLEQQVEQRTANLHAAIQDLETFNYAVSHDLRAPVRQASAYLEAIAEDLRDNVSQETRHMLARSQLALHRMKEMIAGLHAFSQLGMDTLNPVSVNVNDMISSIIDKEPASVRDKVKFEVAPLENVIADRIMLRILLQNLIDNAIKFSVQSPNPVVSFHAHNSPAEWVLEVRDNGIGFNNRYTDNMFQLFQRLHSQEAFPGFGIGLALCHKIVTLHGGRIWAESEPNAGARFFVSLPTTPHPANFRAGLT